MREYTEKQKQIIKVLYPEKYIELFGEPDSPLLQTGNLPEAEPEPETKTDEPAE
tara:strand:+ start:286 stop:447 length:162 start_codon:yes stop_codon:yes gene_type:complete